MAEILEQKQWEECDNKQSVSSKMIFKAALESAGMKIVARDSSHYVILGES